MGVMRLVSAVGIAGRAVSASQRASGQSSPPSRPQRLRTTFETFLAHYVPPGAAENLRSLFTRWTSAGRIDLARTKSLSDLLHQMQQNLQAHQATQDRRYFGLMKAFREGVKAWEKEQAAELARRHRIADELELAERARVRKLAEQRTI